MFARLAALIRNAKNTLSQKMGGFRHPYQNPPPPHVLPFADAPHVKLLGPSHTGR